MLKFENFMKLVLRGVVGFFNCRAVRPVGCNHIAELQKGRLSRYFKIHVLSSGHPEWDNVKLWR